MIIYHNKHTCHGKMRLCGDVVKIYHTMYTYGEKYNVLYTCCEKNMTLCRDVVIIYHSKYTCGDKR